MDKNLPKYSQSSFIPSFNDLTAIRHGIFEEIIPHSSQPIHGDFHKNDTSFDVKISHLSQHSNGNQARPYDDLVNLQKNSNQQHGKQFSLLLDASNLKSNCNYTPDSKSNSMIVNHNSISNSQSTQTINLVNSQTRPHSNLDLFLNLKSSLHPTNKTSPHHSSPPHSPSPITSPSSSPQSFSSLPLTTINTTEGNDSNLFKGSNSNPNFVNQKQKQSQNQKDFTNNFLFTVSTAKSKPKRKEKESPLNVPCKGLGCNVVKSLEWRKGPDGKKSLCNACGLRYQRKIKQREKEKNRGLKSNEQVA